MTNIDQIMEMIDWNQSAEIQSAGRELAKDVKCLNAFLQPGNPRQGKNVWDNCAQILSERSDTELRPYVYDLFKWLEDMNWPGAFCIRERLIKFEDKTWLKYWFEECVNEAKALDNEIWLDILTELKEKII